MATELIKGKTIDEALKLTNRAVMEALDGLPSSKSPLSVLAEQAIKAAVADYYTRQGIDPTPIVVKLKIVTIMTIAAAVSTNKKQVSNIGYLFFARSKKMKIYLQNNINLFTIDSQPEPKLVII